MGQVISEESTIHSTEIGIVNHKVTVIKGYNPEDFVKRKAISQGRVIQYINEGKNISINSPTEVRTIGSPYFKNTIELPEDY